MTPSVFPKQIEEPSRVPAARGVEPIAANCRWSVLFCSVGEEINVDNLLLAAGERRWLPLVERAIKLKRREERRGAGREGRGRREADQNGGAGGEAGANGCASPLPSAVRATVHEPLFPAYTFHFGDPGHVLHHQRVMQKLANGTASVLYVADQEGLTAELLNVERLLLAGVALLGSDTLAVGRRVRVAAGPYMGQVGVVTALDGKVSRRIRRVWINLPIMGQSLPVEVDAELLETEDGEQGGYAEVKRQKEKVKSGGVRGAGGSGGSGVRLARAGGSGVLAAAAA